VPVRFNTIKGVLEGPRPKDLRPDLQLWQVQPRSALAVLTEVVLDLIEGKQQGSS